LVPEVLTSQDHGGSRRARGDAAGVASLTDVLLIVKKI